MDSRICIFLLILLLLCFALVLAWLAAKSSDPCSIRLSLLPQEAPGTQTVQIDTPTGRFLLTLQVPAESCGAKTILPAPNDDEDPE